jgi:ankyrin repeat protein
MKYYTLNVLILTIAISLIVSISNMLSAQDEILIAAEKGDLKKMQELVINGADVNFVKVHQHDENDKEHKCGHTCHGHQYDRSPLFWATLRGHTEVVKYLLDNGADVNLKNHRNTTALHWAALNNYLEIAKILIEYGADINALDNYESTPLMYAVNGKASLELIKLLIDSGADCDLKNKYGKTCYSLAENDENIRMFLKLSNN